MTQIEKLKAHLKTRRGRRDFQALSRLVDLKAGVKRGTTQRSMAAMLKRYYPEYEGALRHYAVHPFFAMLKKDKP